MLVGIADVCSMSRLYVTGSLELVLAKQDIEILFHRNVWTALLKIKLYTWSAYLPGVEVNRDHQGGSSRVRPFHCTPVGLTPAITPNVGNSNA